MPGTNLTRTEARERAALVTTHSYEVELDLSAAAAGAQTFTSVTTARFSTSGNGDTFLDLIAESVEEMTVDGVAVADSYDAARLTLGDLTPGEHTVRVVAQCRYMSTGEGLHRFVDPADSQTYLYSQFEVPDSRRVFAVFEQPDLKATFAFTVTAPAAWRVFSNSPAPQPSPGPDQDSAVWAFTPTPPLSSYVTAVVAGPYQGVSDQLTSSDGRTIPLGVYCRASLAQHLDAAEIIDLTRRGFAFYEEQFDLAYPFAKYDQIFVPEFNAGAMENAGCVTFTDTYVFRSRVADASRERLAITVLHELAHMWFGDLVTMRWWNDLWLNESFAEYASTLACAEATRWTQAWTTFTSAEKTWAYRQDQLPTTHPVIADIRDLADVEVNFDGITYAKGASVLKQLVHWVGREHFFTGLRAYFKAHAWGNAEFTDLLRELSAASGRDLSGWVRVWLQSAGVTTLRAEIVTSGEGGPGAVMHQVTITQEAPPEHPELRPHRLAIGLYDLRDTPDGPSLVRVDQISVDIDGAATEIVELRGVPQPALLLINDDDHAYAKIRLDPASAATALTHLGALDDAMARRLLWSATWDATRDAEIGARQFIELALRDITVESDSSAVSSLLAQVAGAARMYTAPEHRERTAERVATRWWSLAQEAPAGSDLQLQAVRAFCGFARNPEHVGVLRGLLSGDVAPLPAATWRLTFADMPAGLSVDTDLRWDLISAIAAADVDGSAGSAELIDAELVRDATATGQRAAASARAARPTREAKEAAWAAVMSGDLTNAVQAATIGGFGRAHDPELLVPFTDRYFDSLLQVWQSRTLEMAEQIVVGLYPTTLVTAGIVERGDSWRSANPEAPAGLLRLVLENRDGTARALRAQERDAIN